MPFATASALITQRRDEYLVNGDYAVPFEAFLYAASAVLCSP
jgi:hypothetical protein